MKEKFSLMELLTTLSILFVMTFSAVAYVGYLIDTPRHIIKINYPEDK